jgi:hypothetical protein
MVSEAEAKLSALARCSGKRQGSKAPMEGSGSDYTFVSHSSISIYLSLSMWNTPYYRVLSTAQIGRLPTEGRDIGDHPSREL